MDSGGISGSRETLEHTVLHTMTINEKFCSHKTHVACSFSSSRAVLRCRPPEEFSERVQPCSITRVALSDSLHCAGRAVRQSHIQHSIRLAVQHTRLNVTQRRRRGQQAGSNHRPWYKCRSVHNIAARIRSISCRIISRCSCNWFTMQPGKPFGRLLRTYAAAAISSCL